MAKEARQALLKCEGWAAHPEPSGEDLHFHRQLLLNIVFKIYRVKQELLASKGMPTQPVTQTEVFKEYESQVAQLKTMGLWRHLTHGKRYTDRRVNELYDGEFYDNGVPKLRAVTNAQVEPNPDPRAGNLKAQVDMTTTFV